MENNIAPKKSKMPNLKSNRGDAPVNNMELSGSSINLQGQKLPGVFKQQAKNLEKIKNDKSR